jgi:methyl-accepting chemotaxis protein
MAIPENLRRVLAVIIIFTGLLGLVAGLLGAYLLQGSAARLESELASGMDLGLEGLEVVSDTLQVLTVTVDDSAAVMDAAVTSAEQTATTLETLQPAVDELTDLVSTGLPENIDAIQAALPALEQASGTIDRTLRTLADFEWSAVIPIINFELGFGLGIEYDPPIPLDEAVGQVSVAVAGLPSHLGGIEEDLRSTNQALGDMAGSVQDVGATLTVISQDLHAVSESLQEYDTLFADSINRIRQARRSIRDQVRTGRFILTGVLIWLALSQLTPLALGYSWLFPEPADISQETESAEREQTCQDVDDTE